MRVVAASGAQEQGSAGVKRHETDDDMDVEGDGEAKKRRALCLNLAGMDFEKSGGMLGSCEELEPVFVVTNNDIGQDPGSEFGGVRRMA